MRKFYFCIAVLLVDLSAFGQDTYTVNSKTIKAQVPKTLWGVFFEDINRAADGGLYAEMVENRSFDFPKPMTGWDTWPSARLRDGIFMVINASAENKADPKYLAVDLRLTDTVALINSGFDEGMAFKKGLPYNLTLRYRQKEKGIHVRIFLVSATNHVIGKNSLALKNDNNWVDQQVSIIPTDSTGRGKLLVIFEGAGKLELDRVSLFPTNTWKNRPGGLRADLVQKLYDLHPGFLRFPGGCVVEGDQIANRYQWKHTIGALEDREPAQNIWADNIDARPAPDYRQSFGLGFFEYFQLCEDIGAEPLPVINAGLSCQFDGAEVVPVNELEPYITDALDLVEFANGDTTTTWGKRRAALGHPAPFGMKMLGIGNENWGPQYAERLGLFTRRIKARYPEIKLVNATGYSRMMPEFNYMDSVLRARHSDIIDEHFYDTPAWFMANANRYDNYDRNGPKILVGEYAAQSDRVGSLLNKNTLLTALAEACFMTGIERNADVVTMASYAPLFAHVSGWQWTPDLIWFNNEKSYCTPNYYVQQLFSVNKGTEVVPLLVDGKAICGQDSCWASAVIDRNKHKLIVKLVNMSAVAKAKKINLQDGAFNEMATITSLSNADTRIVNSIDHPDNIVPVTTALRIKGKQIEFMAKPYSLSMICVQLKN